MKRRILIPLGDRVLIERIPEAVKSIGGIEIPDQAKEKPQEGLVVALGEEVYNHTSLAGGARVLFGKFAGIDIVIDGRKLLVLRLPEILMIDSGETVDVVDAEVGPDLQEDELAALDAAIAADTEEEEDREDLEAARTAMKETEEIPFDELKQKLNLDEDKGGES